MKTSILKGINSLLLGMALMACLSACSKSHDNTPPVTNGKTAKFTVSVTGAPSSAYVSFALVGVGTDINNSTVWKLNGVTQANQSTVSLGLNNFTGNTQTYVIESVAPLQTISVGVQCLSPANATYTISYKAEINGQVKNDVQNVTVTQNADFTHDYSY